MIKRKRLYDYEQTTDQKGDDEYKPIYYVEGIRSGKYRFSIKDILLLFAFCTSFYYFYPLLEVQRQVWLIKIKQEVENHAGPSRVLYYTTRILTVFRAIDHALYNQYNAPTGFGTVGKIIGDLFSKFKR